MKKKIENLHIIPSKYQLTGLNEILGFLKLIPLQIQKTPYQNHGLTVSFNSM